MATNERDYVAMERWLRETGSYPYYIQAKQREALAASAPVDALFYSHTQERWVTMRELAPQHWFCDSFAVWLTENPERAKEYAEALEADKAKERGHA